MIWLLIAFIVLGFAGALTDAFMWSKRHHDYSYWLKRHIDLFWLIGMGFVVPALFLIAGRMLNQVVLWKIALLFLGLGCGASVIWDTVYLMIHPDRWPSALFYWLWFPGRLRIGFNKNEFVGFIIIRLIVVVITVIWGYRT